MGSAPLKNVGLARARGQMPDKTTGMARAMEVANPKARLAEKFPMEAAVAARMDKKPKPSPGDNIRGRQKANRNAIKWFNKQMKKQDRRGT